MTDKPLPFLAQLSNWLVRRPRSGINVFCGYTNHRGETRLRHFTPVDIWFGSTEWHPEPTLLLRALDRQIEEYRDFKIEDFDPETFKGDRRK